MHFEVITEDRSGGYVAEILMEKLLCGRPHTKKIRSATGLGHIPKNIPKAKAPGARKKTLLGRLPGLLTGYGRVYQYDPGNYAVVILVDADDRDCRLFLRDLHKLLDGVEPRPRCLFRLAIEEIEAWFLTCPDALKSAGYQVKNRPLIGYRPDSVCDTWEKLADVIYPGGAKKLKPLDYPRIGEKKCEWAVRITPHIDINRNPSPSFQKFCEGIRRLANE